MRILLCLLLLGCTESEGRFPVVISTTTDDGHPFPDVIITLGKAVAGKTGPDGKLSVNVRGKEGVKVAVSTDVPKGYKLASPSSSLVLRRLSDVSDTGKGRLLPVEHVIKFAP